MADFRDHTIASLRDAPRVVPGETTKSGPGIARRRISGGHHGDDVGRASLVRGSAGDHLLLDLS